MITARGSNNSALEPVAAPKLPVVADTQGRLRVSKAQRRDLLVALGRSGESLPQFARRMGLKYSTLARWVQNRRGSQGRGRPPQVRLLEAVVDAAPAVATDQPLILHLPGGVRLEVANETQAALAASVVRALAKPC